MSANVCHTGGDEKQYTFDNLLLATAYCLYSNVGRFFSFQETGIENFHNHINEIRMMLLLVKIKM